MWSGVGSDIEPSGTGQSAIEEERKKVKKTTSNSVGISVENLNIRAMKVMVNMRDCKKKVKDLNTQKEIQKNPRKFILLFSRQKRCLE